MMHISIKAIVRAGWICLGLMASQGVARGGTNCGELHFWGYNALSWQLSDGGALTVAAHNMYRDGYDFDTYGVVTNYTNAVSVDYSHNLLDTVEYLAMFEDCSAGAVFTHGASDAIVVEYFKFLSIANAAALDLGFDPAQFGVDYGTGPVEDAAGLTIGYYLAVTNAWANSRMYWGVDTAVFFNVACYGVCNSYAYSGELLDSNFCLVGPEYAVGHSTAQGAFTTLFHNMDCSWADDRDDTIYEALENDNMYGTCLGYAGNPNLGPSPCSSCNIDGVATEEGIFASAGIGVNTFNWSMRRAANIDEFRVFGQSGGSWTLVDTQPAGAYADSSWFGMRSHDTSHENLDAYYVEAIRGVDLIGSSEPVFTEAGIVNFAATSTRPNAVSVPASGLSQLVFTSEPDVVIVAQHLEDSLGLNILDLCAFYTNQGLGVAVISDPNYLEFADIRSRYASLHDATRSPLLVLCGPAPILSVDPRHPLSVPQGQFSDACSSCGMGSSSFCYGDWDYTDIDSDPTLFTVPS